MKLDGADKARLAQLYDRTMAAEERVRTAGARMRAGPLPPRRVCFASRHLAALAAAAAGRHAAARLYTLHSRLPYLLPRARRK